MILYLTGIAVSFFIGLYAGYLLSVHPRKRDDWGGI